MTQKTRRHLSKKIEKKIYDAKRYKSGQRITPEYDIVPYTSKKKKCEVRGCTIILNGYRACLGNRYCSIHVADEIYQDSLSKYRRMLDRQNEREHLKKKKIRKEGK